MSLVPEGATVAAALDEHGHVRLVPQDHLKHQLKDGLVQVPDAAAGQEDEAGAHRVHPLVAEAAATATAAGRRDEVAERVGQGRARFSMLFPSAKLDDFHWFDWVTVSPPRWPDQVVQLATQCLHQVRLTGVGGW